MWFRNLLIHRLKAERGLTAERLGEALAADALQPCGSFQMENRGWVAPREGDSSGGYVHAVERQWLVALGANQKLLPASVVSQVVKERAEALSRKQEHPVGRKQLRDLRERALAELMPKALTRRHVLHAWIDPVHHWLVVNTAADKKAEELLEALRKTDAEVDARRFETQRSPASAMTQWLSSGEAPEGFSIDQDLELRAANDSRAAVRYVNHALDGKDIRDHIAGGKTVTQLGLTWNERVSFVLTDQMQIKRLIFLDILKEEARGKSEDAAEQFDIDFALMTGELARMLADLAKALGGEKRRDT